MFWGRIKCSIPSLKKKEYSIILLWKFIYVWSFLLLFGWNLFLCLWLFCWWMRYLAKISLVFRPILRSLLRTFISRLWRSVRYLEWQVKLSTGVPKIPIFFLNMSSISSGMKMRKIWSLGQIGVCFEMKHLLCFPVQNEWNTVFS